MKYRHLVWACLSALTVEGCANQPQTVGFRMPDGRDAAFVTLPGNGMTPPVVALMTPKASSYNVHVVSSIPLAQSALSGVVAGAEVGAGLAAQGALIRPSRVVTSAAADANTTSQALVVTP